MFHGCDVATWDGRPTGEQECSPKVSWDRLGNPSLVLGGDGEEGVSSMMMGKEEVAVTDAPEAVLSSALMRLDRSVRTCLYVCSEQVVRRYQG